MKLHDMGSSRRATGLTDLNGKVAHNERLAAEYGE